jgi:PEGA domain
VNANSESDRDSFKPQRSWMMTRPGITVVTWLLCASMALVSAQTQPAPKPFTKDEVLKLLIGNVPAKRVEALVRERGIDFQITSETESELRNAGATDPLLAALRDVAPKAPTLVVTTPPGKARVYIDDEFVDTTSPEGRLKLSTLAPGRHKLRVAMDGYRDHEEIIDLAAGKTLEVSVSVFTSDSQMPPPAVPPSEVGVAGAPAASITERTLTIPGRCEDLAIFGTASDGTLTITNGQLQFSPKKGWSNTLPHFSTSLEWVVPKKQGKYDVSFDIRWQDKTRQYNFTIGYMGRNSSKEDYFRAVKELYEALKAGSKQPLAR